MALSSRSVPPVDSVPRPRPRPRPTALGRCRCTEQIPQLNQARPFEVEVCLNCEGVIAVWRRCAGRCEPGGDPERTCLVCGRAAVA